jgi:peptide chain release factor 2
MIELQDKLTALSGFLDISGKQARLAVLDEQLNDPNLWNDPENARKVTQESTRTRRVVDDYAKLEGDVTGLAEMLEIATEEEAASLEPDVLEATNRVEALYRETLFNDPRSDAAAIVTIKPGAGGTESQDWAEMLLRMYRLFGERRGYTVELLDVTPGAEAGISGAEFIIRGERAYGMMKPEHGVHRLVRVSPFDGQNRRHTSFTGLEVVPEIEDAADVEIDMNQVRIDVYRSGGHGGQGVNTTDSAVRLTYKAGLPDMIVVTCQDGRSQLKNKEKAFTVLRSRLFEMEFKKKRLEEEKLRGQQVAIEWGSQIRSYVLDKQYVKDHRTGVMRHDSSNVLDGDIEDFIWAGLEWQAGKRATAASGDDD